MTPRYSRSYIDQVGDIIVADTSSADELESAMTTFNDWRALHLYPMNTFQATLRNYVKSVGGIVAQRLKRAPTIIDKLKNRQKTMRLSRMQDVGGLRAIVSSVPDVRIIQKKFLQSRAKHELKKIYDYIAKPKDTGYRGVHLVYQNNSPKNLDCDGLSIEIQLRTRLQHLWATAMETTGFFYQEALKSDQGDMKRLEFFRLVSALFAHEEGEPTSPLLCQYSKKELTEMLRQFEADNGVLTQLGTIQVANHVKGDENLAKAAYWIIKTDLTSPTVEVYPFMKEQQNSANRMYSLLESTAGQVVLVSVSSVKEIVKAYPSFFLDIGEFIGTVKRLSGIR